MYHDHHWHGPIIAVYDFLMTEPASVIGPRVLDGTAYLCVRSEEELPVPPGLFTTGPELSAAIVGVWLAEPVVEPVLPEAPDLQ